MKQGLASSDFLYTVMNVNTKSKRSAPVKAEKPVKRQKTTSAVRDWAPDPGPGERAWYHAHEIFGQFMSAEDRAEMRKYMPEGQRHLR